MITKKTVIILSIFLTIGALFFAYQHGLIIFRFPSTSAHAHIPTITKKQAKLSYWHARSWHTETTQLLWPNNQTVALEYLINSWLSLVDEETAADKKVRLQTVALGSHEQEAYISFNRSPFSAHNSTRDKLMWVEGLLTTIRENMPSIQRVRLLVHHKPLTDFHLDFTNSWPITGFLH